ncbi:uncharacterized protein LOC133288881 [Gastrolobium bilobum]|uniref:uncharacterized protein LOC133288881 n=1 Tax=Gastrolobium bilobum TaxID=150636 RepID=UPI002AB310FA|nr:uncharacterized protein LOC133288881 [Gastrolobium bilobum]
MPSETVKPSQSPPGESEKHKSLDREIREMVSAITHRVSDFHKSGSTHHLDQKNDIEDEHDVRIITLAGNNDGATLRSELLDDKSSAGNGFHHDGEPDEALSTYVNSNFQAVNNSIMFGGSYHANDPGVHVDISDFAEPPHYKAEKHWKKGKNKEKEATKSERQSGHSD